MSSPSCGTVMTGGGGVLGGGQQNAANCWTRSSVTTSSHICINGAEAERRCLLWCPATSWNSSFQPDFFFFFGSVEFIWAVATPADKTWQRSVSLISLGAGNGQWLYSLYMPQGSSILNEALIAHILQKSNELCTVLWGIRARLKGLFAARLCAFRTSSWVKDPKSLRDNGPMTNSSLRRSLKHTHTHTHSLSLTEKHTQPLSNFPRVSAVSSLQCNSHRPTHTPNTPLCIIEYRSPSLPQCVSEWVCACVCCWLTEALQGHCHGNLRTGSSRCAVTEHRSRGSHEKGDKREGTAGGPEGGCRMLHRLVSKGGR